MKYLIIVSFLVSAYTAVAQNTAIPDYCFEYNLINEGYDTGTPDGYVPTANIESIEDLHLHIIVNGGIKDLTGIQDFRDLQSLIVIDHQLTQLDLSANLKLRYLRCDYNEIDSLDVSMLSELEHLECNGNPISSLDVTNNPKLETLDVGGGPIEMLDISNNPDLTRLVCYATELSAINLSENVKLEVLNIGSNKITDLNLTNNPQLIELNCSRNELNELNVSANVDLVYLTCGYNSITNLDVSNNPVLRHIVCYGNDLICLNVKNGNNTNMGDGAFNAYENPNLKCIEVDDSTWSTNNWSHIDSVAIFRHNCENDCSTSVSDNSVFKLNVFPNPNSGSFYIVSNLTQRGTLKILNLTGQEVFSSSVQFVNGRHYLKTGLIPGIYILHFVQGNSRYVKKIKIE